MTNKIIQLNQLPSDWGTFTHATKKIIQWHNPYAPIAPLELRIPDFRIDPIHFKKFITIFADKSNPILQAIYPMALVYPMMLRLISCSNLSLLMMLKMVSIKNKITCHRKMDMDIPYILKARCSEKQHTKKGMLINVMLSLESSDLLYWETMNTLYFKGVGKDADAAIFQLNPTKAISTQYHFSIPEKESRTFCRLIGDSNGIHYSKRYAQFMGYRTFFAQPYHAVGYACQEMLPVLRKGKIKTMYLEFKGPLYFQSPINTKIKVSGQAIRFDLFSGQYPKPGIIGEIIEE